jgi:uncharacterized protein (DUF305 family)
VVVACGLAIAGAAAPRATAQAGTTPAQGRVPHTRADVHFMSGMITHHAQAVLMAGWAPTHGASEGVRTLCERILVSQRDEIAFMQRWLRERHEAVPPDDPHTPTMPGMDHPPPMPGMLSAGSWPADSARGQNSTGCS